MKIFPTCWSFKRNRVMPILDIKGITQEKEAETYLIEKAVRMIEKACEFGGIPISHQNHPCKTSKFVLMVYFSLIFPSDKDLEGFLKIVKEDKL